MQIPSALVREWRHEPEWVDALPRLAADCADAWNLVLEKPIDTPHALVVAAGDAVLKLNAPAHVEADHEGDALAEWNGRGAVRLLARDDARRALLLERCRPGTRLADTDEDDVGVLLHLLEKLETTPAQPHPFRLTRDEADRWTEAVARRYRIGGTPFERSLLDLALDVFASADANATWLVNQDLHGGNVLRAQREPWLVIDPKPLVGEREMDAVGLLRNAAWTERPRASVRRWLDALSDLGLDRARLREWGVAHVLAWGWSDERGWEEQWIGAARVIADA